MHLSRLHCGLAISCLLTFTLWLAACAERPAVAGKGKDSFNCGDKIVLVVPVDGTSPKDVYLCKGDTLTWQPNGHSFLVTFPKKYPFQGPPTTFGNNPSNPNAPVVSPPAINPGSLAVYHYDMMVDNVAVADPQVVGGGYHSN